MVELSDKSGLRQRLVSAVEDDASVGGVGKALKSLDIFDKYQDSVVQSKSSNGGFLSIFTIVLVALLFFNELDYYFFRTKESYSYTVDKSKLDQHVVLSFDIIIKTPCNQIGAGVSDEAGADIRSLTDISEQPAYFELDDEENARYNQLQTLQEKVDDEDVLFLRRAPRAVQPPSLEAPADEENKKQTQDNNNALMPFGMRPDVGRFGGGLQMQMGGGSDPFAQIFGMMNAVQQMMGNPMKDLAKKPYNKGVGRPDSCRFYGKTTLNKVKGNLHIVHGKKISMGGMGFAHMTIITSDQKPYNFTHRVNQLSFSTVDNQEIYTVQALDGHVSQQGANYFQYFLNVVGVRFTDEAKKFYQFSVTETAENSKTDDRSGLIFRYDFSPILVQITTAGNMSLFMFLIRMCSIVGGLLSISNFVSKMY